MLLRRVAILLVIPALALAAPKHKAKPPTPTNGSGSGSGSGSDTGSGSGSGSGSAGSGSAAAIAPTTDDASKPAPPAPATPTAAGSGEGSGSGSGEAAVDVDSLRQEYLALRDELFKSRARANAVASQLYSTRVSIKLTWESARYYGVSKASIRLDGAIVFEDDKGAIAGDDGVRFDGFIAPGKHIVTFRVEAAGKDDDAFTESTEAQVAIKAVPGKDLVVAARARDGGDIAYEWKKSEHGHYGLGIDVAVKAVANAVPTKAAKK
jgi:hypothetical protein